MNIVESNNIDVARLTGGALILILIVILFALAWGIFAIIGMWKLYKKAGYNGWEAIIPFYSQWILLKIAGLKEYWFLLVVAPAIINVLNLDWLAIVASIATLLSNIAIAYNLKEKFHKDNNWLLFAVLFSGIVMPLLGYSSNDVYDKDAAVSENSFFKSINK